MPVEPMSSTCPACGEAMLPLFVGQRAPEDPEAPLCAEVPIVLRCLSCTDGRSAPG